MLTVERTRVERIAEEGNRRAQSLLRLLENPYRALAPIDFAYAAALIGLALALTWNSFETRAEWLPRVYEIAAVLVVLLLGKVALDFVAVGRALSLALAIATPLTWLVNLSSPVLNFSAWLTRLAKGPRTTSRANDRISSDDIQIIMAEGEEPRKLELIDPDERQMIAGIIEMGQRYASEIMIPRLDVVALDVNTPLQQALDVAIKHGHSRLPVYEEDIDHIAGILHVKDLLQVLRHPELEAALREMLRPVHYVPETAKADDILRDLLRNRVHMAVVVDEYGGTAGVLTIEDVIEEIVGEIRDEYDLAEEPPFTRVNENEALFNGSVPISEVNDVLDVELPTQESDTIGGLVYNQLGRLTKLGDRVHLGNIELTVTGLNGRRIKQVRVVKHPDQPGTAPTEPVAVGEGKP